MSPQKEPRTMPVAILFNDSLDFKDAIKVLINFKKSQVIISSVIREGKRVQDLLNNKRKNNKKTENVEEDKGEREFMFRKERGEVR